MKSLYQIRWKAVMATILAVACFCLAGAQTTGQVTLSFANPVVVSPTELLFDVEIRNSGTSTLQLNAANIHTKYFPNDNVPNAPSKPVFELVEFGPHFAGMSFLPILAWDAGNGVQNRQTQKPVGSIGASPIIPTTATKFYRCRLTTSGTMKNIDVLFQDGTHPSISMSVFINGVNVARTINVAGTPFGNVVLESPLNFRFQPIELAEVKASEEGAVNLIQWTTASERNSQYHIVERSADGIDNWVEIGRRQAAGSSQTKQAYRLEDLHPLPVSHYRLKMLGQDGRFEHSEVVKVERKSVEFGVVKVYPIPTDDKVFLQLSLSTFSNLTISVTDVNGRLLQFTDMELEKGTSDIPVDLTKFAPGTYFVKIDNGSVLLTEQVVKQ
ncbi:MAG: T9SS type A sorting domain-containing protein [Saprospiraceae bacterium]|nr:T9SS type A sorting domain-containing protein [Saprospiraceae bacterium]